MAQQPSGGNVSPIILSRSEVLKRIRFCASASANVSFGSHAQDRMKERDITDLEVLRVLRTGDIEGDVEPGRKAGEWKCKVVARAERRKRNIGVVTIVLRSGRLFVKTVEWEDR